MPLGGGDLRHILQEPRVMSVTTPEYLNANADIVGGLIEVVSLAQLTSFPKMVADPEDIGLVLDALRVLRPRLRELETFDSILHMARGEWDEAVRVLSGLIASAPKFSYARALLAFCLSSKGDPSWRQAAAEALEHNPYPETRKLVRSLEARDELRMAVQSYERTGKFTPTQSSLEQALESPSGKGGTSPADNQSEQEVAGRFEDAAGSGYLRA
jgi:type III secretion protein HrpB1